MTREELEKYRSKCYEVTAEHSKALDDYRDACIRYGFEKGHLLECVICDHAPCSCPDRSTWDCKSFKYESAEQVLAELDKGQDKK